MNRKTTKIYSETKAIGPTQAKQLLKKNANNFRKLSQNKVRTYAHDMINGNWHLNGHVISISKEGVLLNGQHRLAAVVLSGKKIKLNILYNVPSDKGMDCGRPRSVANELGVQTAFVSTIRRMMLGGKYAYLPLTFDDIYSFSQHHKKAVCFVLENFPKPNKLQGLRISPVLGAIARAYHSVNKEELLRFIRVLSLGVASGDEESSAITLRDWLIETGQRKMRGREFTLIAYRKTERALQAFLGKQSLKNLREAKEELYKIPHEFERDTN